MPRRFHVDHVVPGENHLGKDASHHAKTVLRMKAGDEVELFDDDGNVGRGEISTIEGHAVSVILNWSGRAQTVQARLHVASAVPKGSRADWLVEKLSELGVKRFTPLATERAVVLPEGTGKRDRWLRIAEEASRQSGRIGVMAVDTLTPLEKMLAEPPGLFGSTAPPATPLLTALQEGAPPVILIGPEGGWSPAEVENLTAKGWRAVTFGPTVLRVETAAIAAASITMQWQMNENARIQGAS